MKRYTSILLASIAWFAVLTQYYLMVESRVTPYLETVVRFFSFFTILTNSLVAIYFTAKVLRKKEDEQSFMDKPGTLTALTVYIFIVGLVYQVVLRQIWEPTGLQKLVDELLHSVVPVLVVIFWYFFERKSAVSYQQIARWLIYPLVYLFYILIRGHFADFYPYPFVDVNDLGLSKVMVNSAGLMALFVGVSALFIKVGKLTIR